MALAPIFETELIVFLILALVVAIIARKVRFPYTIALVFMGLFVALSGIEFLPLSKEMIFFLFLPPLLFEGAVHIRLEDLKQNIYTISSLAVLGVIMTVGLIGIGIHFILGIPLIYGLLLGAIITPTDPVSVLALFKKLGVNKKLSTIVEGESLFNDGTGVVLFEIILGLVLLHHMSFAEGIMEFVKVVAGGFIIGGIGGWAIYSLMKQIDDHLLEVTSTIILAYGSFILAEFLHVSGVIAVVVAGLLIGNFGTKFAMSPKTRLSVIEFWEIVVFLVNSVIFIMIGATLPIAGFIKYGGATCIAIALSLLARAISVYSISSLTDLIKEKTPRKWKHVMNWGGLKGSIPVALVLGIQTLDIQYKEEITYMTFGVVFFSLVIQGLSMSPLIKRLGVIKNDKAEIESDEIMARKGAIKKALKELKKAHDDGEISHQIYKNLKQDYDKRLKILMQKHQKFMKDVEAVKNKQERIAKKKTLLAEKSAIVDHMQKGLISDEIGEKILHELTEKLDGL